MRKDLEKKAPSLRFPEFKGDWIAIELSKISNKISDGIHSTPKYDEEGEYFFINGNNLVADKIELSDSTKQVSQAESLKHKNELTSQTILISINGTIGNIAFYNNENIVLGKSAGYINLKEQENKLFVSYLLKTKNVRRYSLLMLFQEYA